jgi:EmrB/QacA subfamily drug resistance transporter
MARTDVQERAPKGGVIHSSGAHISQQQLLIIMGGVMLGVLLAALDQTVVGPAMFKIIKDLKGLEHYAWVTTAYLLTSTVTVPIFGKLGDLYGRKWFFVGGVIVFMIGSALSGLASGTGEFNFLGVAVPGLTDGMAQLIIFRGLQGIGGGMIFANAFTIIGDLVPPAERGRWQGLFGAVWGLSSVIGPTIGGYITDNISWQWVFYVNIPVGILCLLVMIFLFPTLAPSAHGSKIIDWLGAGTLVLGITPLLLALSLGGSKDFPWDSGQIITMFVLSAAFLIAFVVVEARAKEPIIPLDLFKNRIFTLSVITMFLVGLGMFGAIINIPLFIQGVQGDSATNSGNSITPMMISVVIVSIISGQLLSRTGKYRWLGIFGMSALTVGMFLLSRMQVDTPRWETIGFMIIMGLGLGVAMPLYTLIVQNAFPPQRLGVVTSATTFFRSIGGTMGVAILGTVVSNQFKDSYLANVSPQLKDSPQFGAFLANLSPQALISPETINGIQQQLQAANLPTAQIQTIIAAIQQPIAPALSVATTEAFLIGSGLLALAILATAFIPEIPLRRTNMRPAMAEGAGEAMAEEAGKELMAEGLPVPAEAEPELVTTGAVSENPAR